MADATRRTIRRQSGGVKGAANAVIGALAVGLLKLFRLADPDWTGDLFAALMQRIGPWLPEHRTGRANLAAAFPEKSRAEIETILRGVWGNLGRVAAEFAHLDRIWDFDPADMSPDRRIQVEPKTVELFARLKNDGKPALVFAAHLANWELPAVCAAAHDLDAAALYRRPNVRDVDRWIREIRAINMGTLIPTGLDAPVKLAEALERGAHVGMLIDQYYRRGVEVEFFGRTTLVNPLLARLARHFDCPIHGARMIRLPGRKFRAELSEAIEPARDADGKIDVPGTMQIVTSVVEGWVREHPDQWLWLHRRWRTPPKFSGRSLSASTAG